MPAVARKNGVDKVFSPHGQGYRCRFSSTQRTDEGSFRVFIEGVGVIRYDDAMISHPQPGCSVHAPTLDTASSRVFSEGKGIARIGDTYGGEHPIISGSTKVFSN